MSKLCESNIFWFIWIVLQNIGEGFLLVIKVNNSKISTDKIDKCVKIDIFVAFRHLKKLGVCLKKKKSTRWYRIKWRNASSSEFLDIIFTSGKKWTVYDNVRRKQSWKQDSVYADSVAKSGLHPMKVLLIVRWDPRSIIHIQLLLTRSAISTKKYCDQLTVLNLGSQEKKTDSVKSKRCHFPLRQSKTVRCKTVHRET